MAMMRKGRPHKPAIQPSARTMLSYLDDCTAARDASGCRIWQGAKSNGRPYIMFGSRRWLSYRLQWELRHGPIPEGLCVCHSCDVPLCMEDEHHWLGTYEQNNRDMRSKGRAGGQFKNKLTDAQVEEARQRALSGEKQASIARDLGVTPSLVSQLVSGRHRPAKTKEGV